MLRIPCELVSGREDHRRLLENPLLKLHNGGSVRRPEFSGLVAHVVNRKRFAHSTDGALKEWIVQPQYAGACATCSCPQQDPTPLDLELNPKEPRKTVTKMKQRERGEDAQVLRNVAGTTQPDKQSSP